MDQEFSVDRLLPLGDSHHVGFGRLQVFRLYGFRCFEIGTSPLDVLLLESPCDAHVS